MGSFTTLVAELDRCAQVGRAAFEDARGADTEVSAADLAELAGALARADRTLQAASVAAIAQFARREEVPDPEDVAGVVVKVHPVGFVEEFASTEVAMTLGISTRSADTRLEQASRLTSRLPRVLAAVAAGHLELGQAARVLYETADLDSPEHYQAVDAYLADRIGACDPTRVGALARYAIARVCPQALRAKAITNHADRCLDLFPGPAGMAELHALVPAAHAAAIWEAASELANDYVRDDPTLTLDQARADAFVDLALANVHVTATVNLGVPVLPSTASDLGDNPNPNPNPNPDRQRSANEDGNPDRKGGDTPGPTPAWGGAGAGRDRTSAADAKEWDRRRDIDHDPWYAHHTNADTAGCAPPAAGECAALPWSGAALSGVHLPKVGYVPPDVVASLVAQLGTRIGLAVLDAHTGTLLHTVRDAYRPDAAMRHFITIRDGRCRMFGCQLTAAHWDLDHATPHPDGSTTPTNLAGLCRRHHRAKQRRNWRYHLMPDGTATWQSPTGTIRATYPEHHLPPPPAPDPPPEPEPVPAATPDDDEPPF